jgi:hypothetical protein
MANVETKTGQPKFDLEERTAFFGENVIGFAKRIVPGPITLPLINQLVRSATSSFANPPAFFGRRQKSLI